MSYGVNIEPIQQLHDRLLNFDTDGLFQLSADRIDEYSSEKFDLHKEIVALYIYAFLCFLDVLEEVMKRKVMFLQEGDEEHSSLAYVGKFIPLHESGRQRVGLWLRSWAESFDMPPVLLTDLVLELVASGTADEMHVYVTNVDTANSLAEVESHGTTGHEIENSIKDFLREKLPFGDRLKRPFQLLNEIIGIIFPGKS